MLGSGDGDAAANVDVRYVDPRTLARAGPPAVVVDVKRPIALRGGDAVPALDDYGTAYAALRRDGTDEALVLRHGCARGRGSRSATRWRARSRVTTRRAR